MNHQIELLRLERSILPENREYLIDIVQATKAIIQGQGMPSVFWYERFGVDRIKVYEYIELYLNEYIKYLRYKVIKLRGK